MNLKEKGEIIMKGGTILYLLTTNIKNLPETCSQSWSHVNCCHWNIKNQTSNAFWRKTIFLAWTIPGNYLKMNRINKMVESITLRGVIITAEIV